MTQKERVDLGCAATTALTADEAKRMTVLPDSECEVDTESRPCEFDVHGSEALHGLLAQSQFDGTNYVSWWLRWGADGQRELKVEAPCLKLDGEEASCLLVADHPGKCDDGVEDEEGDGTGWTLAYVHDEAYGWLWELHENGKLLHDTDDFSRTQTSEVQEWAAEMMLDMWGTSVIDWEPGDKGSERWRAKVAEGVGG